MQESKKASIDLYPDRLDDLGTGIRLRADEGGELLGRVAAGRLDTGREQLVAHLGHRQHFLDRAVQLAHHLTRRACGCDDALPDAEIVAGEGLRDGGNVWRQRKTLRAYQPQNLELVVAPKRQRYVDALHAERNVSGQNAGDLRGPAAIWDHGEIGAGHHVQEPDIDLRGGRADSDLERAGLGLLLIHQFLDRIARDTDVSYHRRGHER